MSILLAGIADVLSDHDGRRLSRADLPGGYGLSLRTRDASRSPLQAALFAPSSSGPVRIAVARFYSGTPAPAAARILAATARHAPAAPDARDIQPAPEAVAPLLATGTVVERPDEPGLFVSFGPADMWLHRNRLGVNLGAADSGISLVLEGPWGAPGTARLTAFVLHELTGAASLAEEVTALLPLGQTRAHTDEWHPDAAVVFHGPDFDPADPLGRGASRVLSDLGRHLQDARPDWDLQKLRSDEGSVVALRITRRAREVPRLVKHSRWVPDSASAPRGPGHLRSEFRPPTASRAVEALATARKYYEGTRAIAQDAARAVEQAQDLTVEQAGQVIGAQQAGAAAVALLEHARAAGRAADAVEEQFLAARARSEEAHVAASQLKAGREAWAADLAIDLAAKAQAHATTARQELYAAQSIARRLSDDAERGTAQLLRGQGTDRP